MRFSIEAQCRRGLRVIDAIPHTRLCRLEGYNGIGKTSAIRLLELCVGGQPYSQDAASWLTFRDQLVNARVSVSSLQGASSIEWEAHPAQWPTLPEPLDESFGSVRINGKSARIKDAIELVQVHHLNVSETFTHTLARRVDRAERTVLDWLGTTGSVRQRGLERRLGELQALVTAPELERLPAAKMAFQTIERTAAELGSELETVSDRLSLLVQAVAVADKLEDVRGRGSELDDQLVNLRRQLEELEQRRVIIEQQIVEVSATQQTDTAAKREFSNAEKHLARQDRRLTEARSEIARLSAAANVEPNGGAVERAARNAAKLLNELASLEPKLHAAPLLRKLLSDIVDRLGEAEEVGLGEQVLVEAIGERHRWTVSELKSACDEQAAVYARSAPTENAIDLQRRIGAARNLLATLDGLAEALRDVEEVQRAKDAAERRLGAAADALPAASKRSLMDLTGERATLELQGREYATQIARLQHARDMVGGGQTEDALAAELEGLCSKVHVDPSRVRGRHDIERKTLDTLQERFRVTHTQLGQARATVTALAGRIEVIVRQVRERGDLSWLRKALPTQVPSTEVNQDDQLKRLTMLAAILDTARDRLMETGQSVLGIGTALRDLASSFRGSGPRTGTWSDAVENWLGGEVDRWFADDSVREALFPGGRDVTLDLAHMAVSWTNEHGKQTRPLSAFSSGEQALAFTRARLAQLDVVTGQVPNRLIALDEFGAFIDAERMIRFSGYLEERAKNFPNDQVVVIVPLSKQILEAKGRDPNSWRMVQLKERGYFTEKIES